MIAIESFRKFKLRDVVAIALLIAIWYGASTWINGSMSSQNAYILSLVLVTTLLSFTVHLVRKAGAATLFCGVGALVTQSINDLGAIGMSKVYAFLVAGVVFEIVFLIFKLEVKNVQLDILLGTAFASATIPLTTSFLLSTTVAATMLPALVNMTLLSLFIGIIGAIVSFLVWYQLRTTRFIIQYEYSP